MKWNGVLKVWYPGRRTWERLQGQPGSQTISTKPKEISLGPSKVGREAIRRQKEENQHKLEANLDCL